MEKHQQVDEQLSIKRYLDFEAENEVRREYYQGEQFARAGTSAKHNQIALNIAFALRQATRANGGQVFASDIRLKLARGDFYAYPDVMLITDKRDQSHSLVKEFPEILVEVLAPSTEANDRGKKFLQYLKLPTLKYYVLISQDTPLVEVFERSEQGWFYFFNEGIEAEIPLALSGIILRSVDIFDQVMFERMDGRLESV